MNACPIGTIFRTFHVTDERLDTLRDAGLECIQIAGCYEAYLDGASGRERSDRIFDQFARRGLTVNALFLSFERQNWTTGDVGITPVDSRAERMLLAARQMHWAAGRGIRLVTCHAGEFPEPDSTRYTGWIRDMKQLCAFAADNGQEFLFEIGPETAETFLKAIRDIGTGNIGINFDPANVLIYNTGQSPRHFLDILRPYIRVIHCKDAAQALPGEKYGRETALGAGDTGFTALLRDLLAGGFRGPLIIERELPFGPEQEHDVAAAAALLRTLRTGC